MSLSFSLPKKEALFSLIIMLFGCGMTLGAAIGIEYGELGGVGIILLGCYYAYMGYKKGAVAKKATEVK